MQDAKERIDSGRAIGMHVPRSSHLIIKWSQSVSSSLASRDEWFFFSSHTSNLYPPIALAPSKLARCPIRGGADGSSIARVLSIPSPNFKGSLIDPPLRASNDITAPSKLARCPIRGGADGSSIARVQRGESATARCASTEDHQAP